MENQTRKILITLCVLCTLFYHSQSLGHAVSETEISKYQIKNIIKRHAYNNTSEGIKNNYDISFSDSSMLISNYRDALSDQIFFTKISINDIDSVVITEKIYNIFLTVKLQPGKKEFTICNYKTLPSLGKYEFILDKSVKKDHQPQELYHAFSVILNDIK